jgi:RNA polymerase sigma factor (TIGR02999 family)
VPECEDPADITQLMQLAGAGDREARESLYRVVYDDLRRLARNLMRSHSAGDLESTALVNEVVLRFEKGDCLQNFANRRVFFSVAIRAMKQILITHYRRRKKQLGGGDQVREPLDFVVQAMEEQSGCDLEALNRALGKPEVDSPRQHQVVMHRFFGGLTIARPAPFTSCQSPRLSAVRSLTAALSWRSRSGKAVWASSTGLATGGWSGPWR